MQRNKRQSLTGNATHSETMVKIMAAYDYRRVQNLVLIVLKVRARVSSATGTNDADVTEMDCAHQCP